MIKAGAKVAIIGAGVAGLAHAICLSKLGVHCEVFERRDQLDERGAGIQISENGAKALSFMGALQPVIDAGLMTKTVSLFDYKSAQRSFAVFDFAQYRENYRSVRVLRATLIKILFARATNLGVKFFFGQEQNANSLCEGLKHDLVIAADGVASKTRATMLNEQNIEFTKQVAWRALIEGKVLPRDEVRVFLAPHRHVVLYQVRPDLLNMVAVEERDAWHESSWSVAGDLNEFKKIFGNFDKPIMQIFDQIQEVHTWGLVRPMRGYDWSQHNITLVGDAAHPSLPFMAQGASMALEGAVIFARSVDSYGVERGSDVYERTYKKRTQELIRSAQENGEIFHQSSMLARRAAQSGLALASKTAPSALLKRWDWIYGFDAAKVRLVR